ncbi:aroma-sacti cluster domain-containing protein [Streptomyces sp. CB03911]|uniref:aroma-sacti cluster domain-containing protein n=1 Tax=Streptomycetaceae TaxID=2062 RepID=UPI000938A712|nr:aroma-sacti cluster domain-containing protein [Streptomyces sp. CB03911]
MDDSLDAPGIPDAPEAPETPEAPLDVLAASGFPIDELTDGQRAVLAALSADEVAVLAGVGLRLAEAGPEVQAHLMVGGLFF